ncbi:putative glycosyltransferase EpsF [Lentibacillus sp. JNUCC-1]|uniref:glycosyltransferase family 1 protein n=1 Tax=Lentibacillus sp. JNUCC-1 TaxID=2654513 RepID=UPI0012E6FF8B|nr:glycosyltransferase family 1 protein [Lentibacillus sp. JNUCC-1]MUV37170.1 putative glycosyltransferase EpsF [Lentibacillus sp. JNUCC-1]
MIRVLHVVSSMGRGGIETFIMNIYRKIDRSKVQFDFLVHTQEKCAYDTEIRSLGGRIFSITPRKHGMLENRKDLNNFFKEHKEYKIVHQHLSSLTYIEPLKLAKKHNVPIRIVHSHNTMQGGIFIHKYIHKFNKRFIGSIATHYFACSRLAAKWLYPKKQYNNNNYQIINNAIDTERFVYNEEIRRVKREELGIEDSFTLGHVGRFTHQKNHELLIDIFKNIHDRCENTKLILVGDGELRKSIEEKVQKLHLKDKVIFTGVRSDIPELLQAMDVFVMPSYHEGLPVTVVEAQASGVPCVLSTNITQEIEILNIVEWCNLTDDLSTWTNSILNFKKINHRNNKKNEIIKAGYDVNDLAKRLEKIYHQVLIYRGG